MMRLGSRTYSLVRAQSGLHVGLNPNPHYPHERQSWRVEAHYVPDDEDAGPALDGRWEYWRLGLMSLGFFTTGDWRELVGLSRDDDRLDLLLGSAENLLARWHHREDVRDLNTGEEDGAPAQEFTLRDELPLKSVRVEVPVNASDPLAAAKALAARELQLTEWARTFVRAYDPARKVWKPERAGKHTVILETPWRQASA